MRVCHYNMKTVIVLAANITRQQQWRQSNYVIMPANIWHYKQDDVQLVQCFHHLNPNTKLKKYFSRSQNSKPIKQPTDQQIVIVKKLSVTQIQVTHYLDKQSKHLCSVSKNYIIHKTIYNNIHNWVKALLLNSEIIYIHIETYNMSILHKNVQRANRLTKSWHLSFAHLNTH